MFCVTYVTMNIQNVPMWLEYRHGLETSAPLVDTVVNNTVFHSNSRINQTPPQMIHILHFSGRFEAQTL